MKSLKEYLTILVQLLILGWYALTQGEIMPPNVYPNPEAQENCVKYMNTEYPRKNE